MTLNVREKTINYVVRWDTYMFKFDMYTFNKNKICTHYFHKLQQQQSKIITKNQSIDELGN